MSGGARPGSGRPTKQAKFHHLTLARQAQHSQLTIENQISQLNVNIVDLTNEKIAKQNEFNQLNTCIAYLTNEISTKQSILTNLNSQHSSLMSSISHLHDQCEAAKLYISDLHDEKMLYRNEIDRLRDESGNLRTRLAALQNDVANAVDNEHRTLDQMNDELNKLQNERKALGIRLDEERVKYTHTETERDLLKQLRTDNPFLQKSHDCWTPQLACRMFEIILVMIVFFGGTKSRACEMIRYWSRKKKDCE